MTSRMSRGRRRFAAWCGAAALGAAAPLARAAVGGLPTNVQHDDGSPEWERLREKLFAGREIVADGSRITLDVPLRAAYGASVPVKVAVRMLQSDPVHVTRMHLLVDKNPSPLAAVIECGAELGRADFETRLRVDEYSHVRAIAELSDGSLHMDSRYCKTSGGCSAPPNRSAPHLIGRTTFKLQAERIDWNALTPVDVTVVHPNDTGFELNNQTVMFIPPHFVRSIHVSYGQRKLFDAELDFSVSENPTLRFHFVPRAPGELRAEVEDSKEAQFVGTLALA